ncbi:putative lipid II flippase MurJ [Amylibacter marinus]|uniref:Probable lipid II flippase MurJ n=1 Tax=Amylibacter marinus TaxID=1475483 RepID=A0ABQ5VUS8_9RHOB|nr:murein biosynthesis integral membrane protein MurJ [Amylibacter marinus]GLQ35006.1 putative lipid II flippase MurJ [Amylibacter marinus]
MKRGINLIGAFVTVGGWTLLSRVVGLVRDLMLAAYLGTGVVAEAFQAAFALPNLFRRFFAEGAFNLAFVPLYAKKLENADDPDRFASDALSVLAGMLIMLTLVAQLFMPYLVYAQASGFAGTARFDLAVALSRIIFPYVLFISLAAVFSGMLNAHGRFAAAAAAPVLLNVILIGAMILASYAGWDMGKTLAIAVAIAGIAQMGLVWGAIRKLGIRIKFHLPKLTPDLKRLFVIAVPTLLTGGVIQINLLVGRNVASHSEGAFAWLYYADRLYQLPLGVVGIAIGIVLLPELARKLAAKDSVAGQAAFNRALEFSCMLTLPAAVALALVPIPLISVLFERGAFDAADSRATAAALSIYALGLPAFVIQKVLQPLYFAREDTRTPFRYALVAMVVNFVLAVGLSLYWGYLAAAIGTTLSAWVMLVLLWRGTRRMGLAGALDARIRARLPRILISSIAMGGVIFAVQYLLWDALNADGIRYIALLGLICAGAVSYGAVLLLSGGIQKSDLRGFIRRS